MLIGLLPDACFVHDSSKCLVIAFYGSPKAAKEPVQPKCDIQTSLLGTFQNSVIFLTFSLDMSGHAVKALRAFISPRQGAIGNGAGYAPVTILKGMDGHKPQVRDSGFQHRIKLMRSIEPFQKTAHLHIKALGSGGLEVNFFVSYIARDNLHGASFKLAPGTHGDAP